MPHKKILVSNLPHGRMMQSRYLHLGTWGHLSRVVLMYLFTINESDDHVSILNFFMTFLSSLLMFICVYIFTGKTGDQPDCHELC